MVQIGVVLSVKFLYTLFTLILGLLVMLIEDRIYHLIKLLLYTAKEENTQVTPTKLQKIFFLLEKEKGVNLGLDFKPWFFGANSSKLQDCVSRLIDLGDIDWDGDEVKDPISDAVIAYKKYYILTSEFKPEKEDKEVQAFFREWVIKSKDEILKYMYNKYPEYFKYSIIGDKIKIKF